MPFWHINRAKRFLCAKRTKSQEQEENARKTTHDKILNRKLICIRRTKVASFNQWLGQTRVLYDTLLIFFRVVCSHSLFVSVYVFVWARNQQISMLLTNAPDIWTRLRLVSAYTLIIILTGEHNSLFNESSCRLSVHVIFFQVLFWFLCYTKKKEKTPGYIQLRGNGSFITSGGK